MSIYHVENKFKKSKYMICYSIKTIAQKLKMLYLFCNTVNAYTQLFRGDNIVSYID